MVLMQLLSAEELKLQIWIRFPTDFLHVLSGRCLPDCSCLILRVSSGSTVLGV